MEDAGYEDNVFPDEEGDRRLVPIADQTKARPYVVTQHPTLREG
jgi:hypothetical protein